MNLRIIGETGIGRGTFRVAGLLAVAVALVTVFCNLLKIIVYYF